MAKETTLGADNALGLAYSLAILTLEAAAGSVESSIMENQGGAAAVRLLPLCVKIKRIIIDSEKAL